MKNKFNLETKNKVDAKMNLIDAWVNTFTISSIFNKIILKLFLKIN